MVADLEKKLVWSLVSNYLNQNDIASLARTNSFFEAEVCAPKLYETIVICKDPVMRTDKCFLDAGKSYLSGYRAVKKTPDQNDIFLYDRIHRLLASSHLSFVKTLVIQDDVFQDKTNGHEILQTLIDKVVELDKIQSLDIRDNVLFERNYSKILKLSNLTSAKVININDLNNLKSLENLKKLELILTIPDFEPNCLSPNVKSVLSKKIEELIVDDVECSSLRLFQYFQNERVHFPNVTFLKFNHVHGIHDYNKTLRELTTLFLKTVFNLDKILRLEMEFACEEPGCECMDDFLMDLAPRLTSLRQLGLIEKNFVSQGDHYTEENWDLVINKFILHLPRVGEQLRKLSIRHNPPLNGITTDSVEGNYIRRRTLYENVLPKLTSLQTLIAPCMLQSICAYEVLVCDLLWNGCECSFCEKALPIFDKFLMNHQYYSYKEAEYKDIIPTVFFAYAGNAMSRRFINQIDSDIKALSVPPITRMWDLHGYERVNHFKDFDCLFDESAYVYLTTAVSHFFNSYMDQLVVFLPNLKTCILSGIYYTVDEKHKYECIYD